MNNTKQKEIKWRPAQLEAITERGKTVLVSAAAGSGKTATLTERIIRRIINDGADISKMLVVTFTKASALDLKAKIFEAVSNNLALDPQNENLTNTMAKLNNARISTIDSFYFDVLKSNFSQANVSPTVKIIDDGEYSLLAKKTMNDVIDDFYQNNDDFPLFIECFTTVRSLNTLNESFLSLYGNLCNVPDGIEFLKNFADSSEVSEEDFDPFSSIWGSRIKECSLDFFNHYKLFLEKAIEKLNDDEMGKTNYIPSFVCDLDFCNKLISALSSENLGYLEIQKLLNNRETISLKSISSKKATSVTIMLKDMRKKYSDSLKKHISTYYSLSAESFAKQIKDTQKHTYTLYELLKEFDLRISEQKKRLNALTFNDIKRKTYELLVCDGNPTETAISIRDQYTDIFIDEYQDVDPIQDEIFKAISTSTNRFLVGDIKQCIYKFRGAKPSLFSDYREAFAREDMQNAKTIFMSENFRCDESIINFTNAICSRIFKIAAGDVKYCDDDDLKYTKNEVTDIVSNAKTSVRILSINSKKTDADADEDGDTSVEAEHAKEEWESSYVASLIASLIGKERKANGELIEAGDIAILFRKNKSSPVFASALKSLGIKVAEPEAVQYFESDDVLLMLAILNAIDNPERDVYLAGTLRSPLFKFSAAELLHIRREYPEPNSLFSGVTHYAKERDDELSKKCKSFIEILLEWQRYASALSIDRFLLTLFNDDRFIASGILSTQNSDGEGGNMLLLYEYARVFSGSSYKGIYEFIEYVNSLIEENKSFSSAKKAKSTSRVSLMTIHKSKGLEFPVCIVTSMGGAFSKNENKKSLVFKHPDGVAMKLADGSGFAQINTPMRTAILESTFKESAEESIRVLYVALTRARERLFVIGTTSTLKDNIQSSYAKKQFAVDRYSLLMKSNSFLDWIMLYLNDANPPFVDFSVLDATDMSLVPVARDDEEEQMTSDFSNVDEELAKKLSDSFKFKYKYTALSEIPSKLSVSSLSATEPSSTELNGNGDRSENTENTENADFTPAKIPAFFSEDGTAKISSAERGTATHLFLQFCNFKNLAERGVEEELCRLQEMGFLQSGSEKLIFKKELEKFAKSKFIEQIIGAEKVIREQRFNVLLDPKIYVSDEEILRLMGDEKLAVQGVIDLVLVEKDGSIRLFDYKTDRLSGFKDPKCELTLRYSKQLSCYARAIELMFEKKCKSVQIYSTQLGQLYDIDTFEVE